jgi:hypothetical protein
MSVNQLFIYALPAEFSVIEMFDIFYADGIATISEIYYTTYYHNGYLFNDLYITIHNWHDTEVAYNFIRKLRNSHANLIYDIHDDLFCYVYILKHNRPSTGYSLVNYLIHPINHTFTTFDFATLPILDKQFDLLTTHL